MDLNKLIMYLAGMGVIFCIIMAFTSKNISKARAADIKNYTCVAEQYSEVNYKTNRCMLEDNKLHETCFYNTVTSVCTRKGDER